MANYEIVLDSTLDLNKEMRTKYGIYEDYIRGIVYLPDGSEILADTEWQNYSSDEFYKIVKKKVGQVKTAFATGEEFVRVVEPILKDGKDVMVFVISTGLSGTYNAYKQYAEMLMDDYPNNRVVIIDTLKYGSAGGLLAVYAAKNRENGMSFEDNVKWANENKHKLHESGPMDDLRFLAKNGRIAAGKAFFGQLVGVQPVADFTRGGMTKPLGTVKGEEAANKASLEYLKQTIVNPEEQIVFVGHSQREERAKLFKKQLEEALKVKEVVIVEIAQSCAVNMGPGLCCYFYMGGEITEARESEEAAFLKIKESLK